jgi:hypothetical protein
LKRIALFATRAAHAQVRTPYDRSLRAAPDDEHLGAETRFRIWFEIEAHALDAMAELGIVPKEAAARFGNAAPLRSSGSTPSRPK